MKRIFLPAVLLLLCLVSSRAAAAPNFLVVLADDLGYGDLGCYGNEAVHTPHLDRLAAEGLRFTDCYAAAANCSPSRAGLMTGRTPWRLGIHNWIPMLSPMHLQASETTIATLLRDAGYATCHAGKWHLNGMFNLTGQPQPDDHGFEHWFSVQNNALPNHRNPYNFVRNGIPVGPLEGYSSGLVTDEAVAWLRHGRDAEKPFFLFVCYHEPHEPIATAPEFERLYAHLEDPAERAYWGNITQMDAALGRLLGELESLGLADDTFVFFSSDNGPAQTSWHPYGSTGPLRAKKGYLWEGGIRVPGIVRWPGRIPAGGVSSEPVCGTDLLPTVCDLAGIEPPAGRTLDGASWRSLLEKGEAVTRTTPLYWHFLRASGDVKAAIREGDWKLVARIDQPGPKPSGGITAEDLSLNAGAKLTGFELYHLREDPGETRDRGPDEPARFAEMRDRLVAKFGEVRSESPVWPEWEFPRYEGQRIEWPPYKALRKPPEHGR